MVFENVDIFELIYDTIFQIPQNLINQYPAVQEQLLFLILIPHIILLLFLWSFGHFISPHNRGIKVLVSIAGYLFFVITGWYGTHVVPLVNAFWVIMIGAAFVFFILSRLLPPIFTPGGAKLFGELGKGLSKKTIGKSRRRKSLERRLEELERTLSEMDARYHGNMPERVAVQYFNLKHERNKVEKELEEL